MTADQTNDETSEREPLVTDIACEHCGAAIGEPCVTKYGMRVQTAHAPRRYAWFTRCNEYLSRLEMT